MKTNYRRNFIARDDRLDNKRKTIYAKDMLLGIIIGASSGLHCLCCGQHGLARDRKGAKKYIHSRLRRKTKLILDKIDNLI